MPVPTFHPDDGPDSHLHSPRRKSYTTRGTVASRVPMVDMPGTLDTSGAAMIDHASFLQGMSTYQKDSEMSSSSVYFDPFGEAAYQDWMSSVGMAQQQPQGQIGQQTIWPNAVNRNSGNKSGHDGSNSGIPDYLAFSMSHNFGSGQIGLSGFTIDDDSSAESLKVPTNTPIGVLDGDIAATGSFHCPMTCDRTLSLTASIGSSIWSRVSKCTHICRACSVSHPLLVESTTPSPRHLAFHSTSSDSTPSIRNSFAKGEPPFEQGQLY